MSKVRINDLARELEVKSRVILDILPEVGVTEKKTHSSSVEEDEAGRVRAALGRGGKSTSSAAGKTVPANRSQRLTCPIFPGPEMFCAPSSSRRNSGKRRWIASWSDFASAATRAAAAAAAAAEAEVRCAAATPPACVDRHYPPQERRRARHQAGVRQSPPAGSNRPRKSFPCRARLRRL